MIMLKFARLVKLMYLLIFLFCGIADLLRITGFNKIIFAVLKLVSGKPKSLSQINS